MRAWSKMEKAGLLLLPLALLTVNLLSRPACTFDPVSLKTYCEDESGWQVVAVDLIPDR